MKLARLALFVTLMLAPVSAWFATQAALMPIRLPTANCANIVPSLSASRASGKVPLSVFFDASGTTDSGVTTSPFHELEYRWSFGDSGSGSWGDAWVGSSGSGSNTSRNADYGPLASHVFETAGTYTVTLTVYDGTSTCAATTQIVASDWANDSATICVSTSSNWTGCPTNADHAVQTSLWATAAANISDTHKRMLFRCGETWTYPDGTVTNFSTNGPGLIGAYNDSGMVTNTNSTCTRPKITGPAVSTGTTWMQFGAASIINDWRIMDLEVDGAASVNNSGFGPRGNPQAGLNQFLFLRTYLHDLAGCWLLVDGIANQNNEHAIVDSTCLNWNNGDAIFHSYPGGSKFAILGSFIYRSGTNGLGQAIRTEGADKTLIAHSEFSFAGKAGQPRENLTVRALSADLTHHATRFVISDNKSQASAYTYAIIDNSQGSEDGIIERNHFILGSAAAGTCIRLSGGSFGQINYTIRNNLCQWNTGPSTHTGVEVIAGTSNSTGIKVYNNSFYDTASATSSFSALTVGASVSVLTAKNNLAYAPNMGNNAVFILDSGSGTVKTPNSADADVRSTSPFATPTVPTDWKPGCTVAYPCAQGAAVPVWSDFFRVVEPGTRDFGAINH